MELNKVTKKDRKNSFLSGVASIIDFSYQARPAKTSSNVNDIYSQSNEIAAKSLTMTSQSINTAIAKHAQ